MLPAAPRWGYTSILLAISVGLTVWLLQQAGRLESWNGFFYDRILTWTSPWHRQAPKVLMIQTGHEGLSDTDAILLLETLRGLGAKGIVFNFLPHNSRSFFQRAVELPSVVFGRELRPDPDNADSMTIEPWPAAAGDLSLQWGVVYLHPGMRGVYRWHQAEVMAGRNPFPTIEMRAASLQEPTRAFSGTRPFLVSFLGPPGSIPNLGVARVLAGDLIPELVKGKWVLVGSSSRIPGLYTPVCARGQTMSLLEFEANSLQTLLDGAAISPVGGIWTLLLLLSLAIGTALLYARVTSSAGVRVAIGSVLLCAAGATGAITVLKVWIPLGALVLAQAGQLGFTLVLRTRLTSRALRDMRLRALKQIRERFALPDSQLTPEQWNRLADMIQQTLNVQRMVLLERVPETNQLRETRTFNCGFDDVQEKARILEAPVFTETLAKGTPVRVQVFFTPGRVPEQEYLCPLLHEGEVIGVWGVAIDAARCPSFSEIEPALLQFAQHIARLWHLGQDDRVRRTWAARVKDWFSSEKEDETYQELKTTAESLERYYDVLEIAFSQIGSATVVYDFFGNVLKANDLAMTLLAPENLSASRATAVQLLRLVTGNEEVQVRRLLRTALLEGLPASQPIRLPSQGERQFLLRVNPLMEPGTAGSPPAPAKARGIVCEILETTSLATLASLKGLVADRLGVELRGHLASIEMSASLMESESLAGSERQMALEVIREKIDVCVQVISACQKYLGRDVNAARIQCFPVEALEVLNRVCDEAGPLAMERKVALEIKQPRLTGQVLASTDELARFFSAVIELLLKDSAENTTLSIEVEDKARVSIFRFGNCGFGIPNERLQTILASTESAAAEPFQVLRQAAVWVRNWGGRLEISSDVGKGYCVTLQLRQFSLRPDPEEPKANESNSRSGEESPASRRSQLGV